MGVSVSRFREKFRGGVMLTGKDFLRELLILLQELYTIVLNHLGHCSVACRGHCGLVKET